MRGVMTARQAREAQAAGAVGEGVEGALKGLGMSRSFADSIGDAVAAATGSLFGKAPSEVRDVVGAAASVALPPPPLGHPMDPQARALELLGIKLQDVAELLRVGERTAAGRERLVEVANYFGGAQQELNNQAADLRELAQALREVCGTLQAERLELAEAASELRAAALELRGESLRKKPQASGTTRKPRASKA